MCHLEASAEGSPRAYFYVAPREARGPPALACLGMTRWEAATPRGLPPGDAVPNEVRDAPLSLGRTKRALGTTE